MNQNKLRDEIIAVLSDLALKGQREAHAFAIACAIQKRRGDRLLTPHGTIYRALRNLESKRVITSRRESSSEIPQGVSRPIRHYYRLTGAQNRRKPTRQPCTRLRLSHHPRSPQERAGATDQ